MPLGRKKFRTRREAREDRDARRRIILFSNQLFIYNRLAGGMTVGGIPRDLETGHMESEEEPCGSFLIGNGAFITRNR